MGFFSFLFKGLIKPKKVSAETTQKIMTEWKTIDLALKQAKPSQLRQALISADKCLDNALRDLVEGNSMGERLKNSQNKFEWDFYQKIWNAHKIRNNLVHEAGYEPMSTMLIRSIGVFKDALSKLGLRV